MTVGGYLIYHPRREMRAFGGTAVYYDGVSHNQDPYIWGERFLHTACHMTQMSPRKGHTNFWLNAGCSSFARADALYCDLVFVVQKVCEWEDRNFPSANDPMIDSLEAFSDHYDWMWHDHPWKRGTRHTLKADIDRSFQPQDGHGSLLDFVPALISVGLNPSEVKDTMSRAGWNTRPYPLDSSQADALTKWIDKRSPVKLRGPLLRQIRLAHSDVLAGQPPPRPVGSPQSRTTGSCD